MANLVVQQKYISILGAQLDRFKKLRPNVFTFRCPACGDSKTNRYKTRGYIYINKSSYVFHCHNCGKTQSFDNFLKDQNPWLFNQFKLDGFSNQQRYNTKEETEIELERSDSWREILKPAVNVPEALRYLQNRKIPEDKFDRIFYVEDMNLLKREFMEYLSTDFNEEPRIVLPILSANSILVGMICRAIYPSRLRYINLRHESSLPLVFNLDKVDKTKQILVFEGAFDSLFFKNSIAVDGADFGKVGPSLQKERDILCYDNQPRNKELLRSIERSIDNGWQVCTWPNGLKPKDVNEMILAGMRIEQIEEMIRQNAKSGLQAKLEFGRWKKRD